MAWVLGRLPLGLWGWFRSLAAAQHLQVHSSSWPLAGRGGGRELGLLTAWILAWALGCG